MPCTLLTLPEAVVADGVLYHAEAVNPKRCTVHDSNAHDVDMVPMIETAILGSCV